MNMYHLFSRKLISASISACLFVVVYALFVPSHWVHSYTSWIQYISHAWKAIPIYLMYAFPVILIYGTLTSLISEYLLYNLIKFTKINRQSRAIKILILGILHLVFGLVLLYISLLAAFLFFLTDLWLAHKRRKYDLVLALKSFLIPVCLFFICIGLIWFFDKTS
ncbi:hypothetical protein [Paenibacillus eucommiae]|uniref:Uncharacterized protein n=1 Tax=Paenibacillus eucommiae TaxID=1355755 RepID=A0ABS4J6G5_9BACL|nr:hypothetical protein [Paenibacillus eucommiae]MBP1995451.1 hypothetical protein [Paenibacillus eucommiae]